MRLEDALGQRVPAFSSPSRGIPDNAGRQTTDGARTALLAKSPRFDRGISQIHKVFTNPDDKPPHTVLISQLFYTVPSKPTTTLRPLTAVFAALAILPGVARATTAVTAPVGYVRHEIPSGFQTVGITLLHEATAVTTITAADAAGTLTLNTSANIGALLEASRPYYVEISSGPFEGDRLEVDVAATIATGGNRVAIKSGDATNTLSAPGLNLAGYPITLRRHVTIADVFGDNNHPIMQSGDAATADEVYLYDAAAERFVAFYFYSTANGAYWRAEDGSNANNQAIRPGEGVLVNRRSPTTTEAIVMGEVRTHDFVQPLKAGLNFVAEGAPVDQTPRERLMDQANGFHAGSDATDADMIYVFCQGAWHQYFLASAAGGAHWCNPAKPQADFSNTALFTGTAATLIFRGTDFPDYVVPSQIN